MSRNTLIAVAVIALAANSILSAGDFYTGPIPTSIKSAKDQRTDLEKLQDQVNEMAFFLDEALYVIDDQDARIDDLEDALADNQDFIQDLKDHIAVGPGSLTIDASTINLDADFVDIDSPMVEVSGDLKSDEIITDKVRAKAYTPGAGNIW